MNSHNVVIFVIAYWLFWALRKTLQEILTVLKKPKRESIQIPTGNLISKEVRTLQSYHTEKHLPSGPSPQGYKESLQGFKPLDYH